jgi:hypothetical protein
MKCDIMSQDEGNEFACVSGQVDRGMASVQSTLGFGRIILGND